MAVIHSLPCSVAWEDDLHRLQHFASSPSCWVWPMRANGRHSQKTGELEAKVVGNWHPPAASGMGCGSAAAVSPNPNHQSVVFSYSFRPYQKLVPAPSSALGVVVAAPCCYPCLGTPLSLDLAYILVNSLLWTFSSYWDLEWYKEYYKSWTHIYEMLHDINNRRHVM